MGNLEIYEFLTKDITDVNPKTNNGITPLHMAAKIGHLEVYKLICQNTNDKNPMMSNNLTPLHLATKNGHLEVVKLIAGDDNNIKPMIRGTHRWGDVSLFKLAIYRGRFQLARFIFENNIEDIQLELRTHALNEFSLVFKILIFVANLFLGIIYHTVFASHAIPNPVTFIK